MPSGDNRQLGTYFAIAQVGTEMVLPAVLGLWIDSQIGSTPWITVVCIVLGFSLGIAHLVALMNKADRSDRDESKEP